MISAPLLKRTWHSNVKMWGILTGTLMLLLVAIFFAGSSFENSGGMIIQQYYTLFAALVPLIFIASTANKLIAAQVDNGSFAYIMSNPIKRKTVVFTQALYLILSIVGMYALITLTGLIAMLAIGNVMETQAFLLLNLGSMLLNLALSGIAFCASCFFNTSRMSLAIGAGVPVAFLLFRMLSDFSAFSESMELFKYITLNTLFNVSDVMAYSTNIIWQFAILIGVAAIGYIAGGVIFKRKDLPL